MVSTCAPFWNRQPALDEMVATYRSLYPGVELSICDDGSIPPAKAPEGVILTRLAEKSRSLNPCVPINRAVAASSGDVIVLTNPEVVHRESVLGTMFEALETPWDYVTARCYDVVSRLWLAGPEVDYSTGGRLPVPPGAHFHFLAMLHRSLWDRAGGFDEDYREVQGCDDNDWLWRLSRVGARFRTAPVTVYHERSTTRWDLPHGREMFRRKWPEVAC